MTSSRIATLLLLFVSVAGPAAAGENVFSVKGDQVLLNGRPFKVIGLRCSNALMSDRTTQQVVEELDTFKDYGVNTVSVFFMGSRFGDVKGYRPDASLDPVYARRMARIIEHADERGMVVLVGCLYWSNSRAKEELEDVWTQRHANDAITNTVRWLSANEYRNVFVDVDNEGMAHDATGWSISTMIDAGHAVDQSIMIAYNDSDPAPANADLYIHHSPRVEGKPWIQSEGTPPRSNYWGSYSKRDGYYNYINIGIYTDQMKADQLAETDRDMQRRNGHMLASTWLQCVPPHGPNQRPGGPGTEDNPGIHWWLEHVRRQYGPWEPSASD